MVPDACALHGSSLCTRKFRMVACIFCTRRTRLLTPPDARMLEQNFSPLINSFPRRTLTTAVLSLGSKPRCRESASTLFSVLLKSSGRRVLRRRMSPSKSCVLFICLTTLIKINRDLFRKLLVAVHKYVLLSNSGVALNFKEVSTLVWYHERTAETLSFQYLFTV